MAKIGVTTGVDYQADFDATEKQGGSFQLLPHMYALLQAESIDLKETLDGKGGWQANIFFEVIEPIDYAGQKFPVYWTIVHPEGFQNGQYKYGKGKFDAFGRAIGVDLHADTDTDDLTFRSFAAEVDIEIGGPKKNGAPGEKYKDRNAVRKFFYTDDMAKEPVPEFGLIEGATPKPAANDNRQVARPAQAAATQQRPAATGAKPWAKRAA
ncbi:MAG: hypothetical protein OJJ21_16720 [Ferrovibrio sp.]|uniref:hypothetical protein n=1 Tax=Ferrovibrio sp. TaxID=1917215 RepID=UPI00263805A8|nr:hypothetical protein [Ferrovibrio sp.]MCW0235246.1 hypothetical protein [Ferrovibrio sp.]